MLNASELKRYNRHIILPEIGMSGQLKLKQAKVLIFGMGGLGCPIAQYIAAAGVGTIGMVDFDVIDASNLQRQVLYTSEDIGKLKVEVAAEKIKALNPFASINAYPIKCAPGNILDLVKDYDIIADCTDNYSARYLINDACITLDKPFVSASVFKFESQLSVYNYKGGPTYRCLFSEPPEEALNCAEAGVVGVLTGIVGTLQANEIVKMITGAGDVLAGKLLLYNALSNQTTIIKVGRMEEQVQKIRELNGDLSLINYEVLCATGIADHYNIQVISPEELRVRLNNKEDIQLIDVREEIEHEADNIGGDLISLYDITTMADKIAKDKPVVLYCSTGQRSTQAIAELRKIKNCSNVFSLKGGLLAWDTF